MMRQPTIALFGSLALLTGLAAGALAGEKGKGAAGKRQGDNADSETLFILKGHRDAVWSVCFSRDGKELASASKDRTVKLWEAATGKMAFSLDGHADQVLRVAFSPDGRWLATAGADRVVKVWDVATGKEVRK